MHCVEYWLPLPQETKDDEEFAIVFAAMGVNMETAHFFKQVTCCLSNVVVCSVARRSAQKELNGTITCRILRRMAPWTKQCCS